jgi:hypothetical protein
MLRKFYVKFKPNHFHVNLMEDTCGTWNNKLYGCKEYKPTLTVYNPAGHQSTHNFTLRVRDKRLKNKIVVPEILNQGLDLSLQVAAYDFNKEIPPKITIRQKPKFGIFTIDPVDNPENHSSVLNIEWRDIPVGMDGKSHTLQFDSCVRAADREWTNCDYGSVTIYFEVRDRLPPKITRTEWANGEIAFLEWGKTHYREIKVVDMEDSRLKPQITITPKEMRKYVSYRNGELVMKFNKSGIFEFEMNAKSQYNVSSAESFIVEVFQKNRSKNLFFTDSTRDPEVKFYRSIFPNIDIMNPAIQDINIRNISGRENLIIGTSTLYDLSVHPRMVAAIDKIKNVIVASPLLENLPENLMTEINQDYGVSILGRYSDISHMPPLKDVIFVHRGDFKAPKKDVQLKMNASTESDDPLLLQAGVDTTFCRPVLEVASKDKKRRADIGVICNRKNGGRLALMGTEFADLKVSNRDDKIPYQWLMNMLENELIYLPQENN